MKVLITGATGFIGRNLLALLALSSPDISLLLPCRNPDAASELFPAHKFKSHAVCGAEDWERIREFGPQVVIHLAALCTSRNDSEALQSLIESNILYGVRLLDALRGCPSLKLFVNTGSFAEYRRGIRTIDNAYLYSATKSAFRHFLEYYASLGRYQYVTAVPYSVYGGLSKTKRIFDYLLEALDAPKPVATSPGLQTLDFVHVEDVCRFFASTILNTDKFLHLPRGREFHLGTGTGHTIRQAAQMIEELTGKSLNLAWGSIPYRDRDVMHSVAPISINQDLWQARTPLRQGLQRMISARQS